VRSADLSGLQEVPVGVIAEVVQVSEHLIEAEGEVAADVLEDAQGGP
jgi:hypothetical protein